MVTKEATKWLGNKWKGKEERCFLLLEEPNSDLNVGMDSNKNPVQI